MLLLYQLFQIGQGRGLGRARWFSVPGKHGHSWGVEGKRERKSKLLVFFSEYPVLAVLPFSILSALELCTLSHSRRLIWTKKEIMKSSQISPQIEEGVATKDQQFQSLFPSTSYSAPLHCQHSQQCLRTLSQVWSAETKTPLKHF